MSLSFNNDSPNRRWLRNLLIAGIIASVALFYVEPALSYIPLAFMAMGLVAGLVYFERLRSRLHKAIVLIPITWTVIILALAVAKISHRYLSL